MKFATILTILSMVAAAPAFAQHEDECIQVTVKAAQNGIIKNTTTAKKDFYDSCMRAHQAKDDARQQPVQAPQQVTTQQVPQSVQREIDRPRNGQRFVDLILDAGHTVVHTGADVAVIKALVGKHGIFGRSYYPGYYPTYPIIGIPGVPVPPPAPCCYR